MSVVVGVALVATVFFLVTAVATAVVVAFLKVTRHPGRKRDGSAGCGASCGTSCGGGCGGGD
ncbi:hypothetical protein ACOACO_03485 [Nocardioides sp. CPCC 205120]|uniref:hypothetical protein n=1 Tax=Nocardioides sp. CPCC 205120 TaxID=3406462 RepID=UPI003B50ADF2